jgi:RNA polymerase sigma factor (sigma-70 family)
MRLVSSHLYKLADTASVQDGVLLERFHRHRDEAAFELLVHRHGAMVLSVCRRVVGNVHDAEDAFQATFLTLARRSTTIVQRGSLGSWLYKVAYRIALRCRSRVKATVSIDQAAPVVVQSVTAPLDTRDDAAAVTDEVAQLSERLRTVIILCCVQGKSSIEAARELGCPVNTISTRLFRARALLKKKLSRRGILLNVSLSSVLTMKSASAVSPALALQLTRQASQYLAGAALPAQLIPLVKGATPMLWWKSILAVLVTTGSLGLVTWTSLPSAVAQETASKPLPMVQLLPQSTSPTFQLLQPTGKPAEVLNTIDLDGDGVPDLIETINRGSGPASTYYANYTLTTGAHYKLLKNGLPLNAGELLNLTDLWNTSTSVELCASASSFQIAMKPEEAHNGLWARKKAALGLARLKNETVQLGYVVMSVDTNGTITIHDSHWQPLPNEQIAVELSPTDDIDNVKSQDLIANKDANMKYTLIQPTSKEAPAGGYGLILVMAGGDGGADFQPFIKRIYQNAVPAGFLVVHVVSKKWSNNQQIVWPTSKNKVPGMKFTTEEFLDAVITDVGSKHKLNKDKVFTLSWSSSGPAAYAASLTSPNITGSFVAMSVFNPKFLPEMNKAKGKAFYLYHSPEDRMCPYRMAEQAGKELTAAGASVELKTYEGGHGWKGNIFDDIRTGLEWLDNKATKK